MWAAARCRTERESAVAPRAKSRLVGQFVAGASELLGAGVGQLLSFAVARGRALFQRDAAETS